MLVDGDDMNEPIADAARSILDGHVVLSRHLAHAGHYPAIDVLQSVSRLVGDVVSEEVRDAGQRLRWLLAAYRAKEDLISIGAYQEGTDRAVDAAILKRDAIFEFLRQRVDEASTAAAADAGLLALVEEAMEPAAVEPPVSDAAELGPGVEAGPTAIPPLHLSV